MDRAAYIKARDEFFKTNPDGAYPRQDQFVYTESDDGWYHTSTVWTPLGTFSRRIGVYNDGYILNEYVEVQTTVKECSVNATSMLETLRNAGKSVESAVLNGTKMFTTYPESIAFCRSSATVAYVEINGARCDKIE